MGLTPTLIGYSSSIAELLLKLPLPSILKTGLRLQSFKEKFVYKNHTLIIGFGLTGKNLAKAAKAAGISYLVLEMNAQTVRDERRKGEPIQYGDATHESVLNHVNISEARIVTVVINDFTATCRIVELIRRVNPHVYIIVRTRYFNQVNMMYELGASDVIPDELGSSIEIFTRVMNLYQVPVDQIEEIATSTRVEAFKQLQRMYRIPSTLFELKFSFPEIGIDSLYVGKKFEGTGKPLSSIDLRGRYGLNLIAIKRGGEVIANIGPETSIMTDDHITVIGEHKLIKAAISIFDPKI